MHRRARAVVISLIAIAIGLSAAAPAAAAHQGRIVFVNGRPGSNVEVCINGKEVTSSLRYGQHVVRLLGPADKMLKFRKSRSGTCRGDLLGKTSVALVPGGDWVVLLTRFAPNKVLVWDAATLGASIVMRHGADLGTVGFKWTVPESDGPWVPALDAPYVKGQWGWGYGAGVGKPHIFWAHQPPAQNPIAGPIAFTPEAGRRFEGILIGTSLGNVRLKLFSVPQSVP
jgi:hypothetical protein